MTDDIVTMTPAEAMDALKLTVTAVFVPFSQSRNKDEDRKTLNWRVTLLRDGREVLTTDYSAGAGHAPGYKATRVPSSFVPHRYKSRSNTAPSGWVYRMATPAEALAQYRDAVTAAECESGVKMGLHPFGSGRDNVFLPVRVPVREDGRTVQKHEPIMPDPLDVVYSLTMDSSVLDAGGFEEWAAEFGYDLDSRKAEATYRACLEIALKMRGAIGDSGLALLAEAFQDY